MILLSAPKERKMIIEKKIKKLIETLLRETDPNAVTSLYGVVQHLEAKLGLDLSQKIGFIKDHINLLLRSTHKQALLPYALPKKDNFALPIQHNSSVAPQQQPLRTGTPVAAAASVPKQRAAKNKRKGGQGGLVKVCGVSPELQVIVGDPELSRTEIVKKLWVYIREHNLQDPDNKRKINCDDALKVVFEADSTDMFRMNKLLTKHINAIDPLDRAKRSKIEVEKSSVESLDSDQSPVKISDALAKFFATSEKEMLQSEAVRRVWEYVKVNPLEEPLNSTVILCDAKLQELLGCESISCVDIPGMLTRHHFLTQ